MKSSSTECVLSDQSSKNDLPIGVFDSGVGGLTVMRAVTELLPYEDIIYLGDTARVPYGNRGPETIRRYAINATNLLAERGVKAIVVACNTASAFALEAVVDQHDMPVLGVIEPVARTAAAASQTGSIGVIGTRGTVRSGCYPAALERLRPGVSVHQTACPLFVPLAEEGWISGDVPRQVAREYLAALGATGVDTLILGCTHYPILRQVIADALEKLVDQPVTLYDSASSTARDLRERLGALELLRGERVGRGLNFLLTDVPDGFKPTAERFFGSHISDFEHVDIPVAGRVGE
jgi:glutamate racemase